MKLKRRQVTYIIGALITVIFVILAFIRFLPFERLEMLLYDVRYHLRGKSEPPPEIVIVGIDDKSLKSVGRWPWDRSKTADLIERINSMDARVIMLDFIFSEPSSQDPRLVAAIKRKGNVVLPFVFDFEGSASRNIDDAFLDNAFMIVEKESLFQIHRPITAKGVLLPVSDFSTSAAAMGYINMLPDADGKLRWEALIVSYMDQLYPSIDVQVARLYKAIGPGDMSVQATDSITLGEQVIKTDPFGKMLIPYFGPHNTFPVISALDIFEGKVNPALIKDKIILIGPTAVGIHDRVVSPSSAIMYGIEKHANMIGAILQNQSIRFVGRLANLLVIICVGLIFTVIIVNLRALPGPHWQPFFY
jgi:adenylate cyclase